MGGSDIMYQASLTGVPHNNNKVFSIKETETGNYLGDVSKSNKEKCDYD